MRNASLLLILLTVPLVRSSSGQSSNAPPRPAPAPTLHVTIGPEDVPNFIGKQTDFHAIVQWKDACKSMPSYIQIGVVDFLADQVARRDEVGLDRVPGIETLSRHDLSIVSARVAFLLEHLTGLELPVVNRKTLDERGDQIAKEMRQAAIAYRNGLVRAGNEYGSADAERMKSLNAKYAGKISFKEAKGLTGDYEVFEAFLSEWFPIGKRLQDLEEIVQFEGEQVLGQPDVRYFPLPGEAGSPAFVFRCKGGMIESVFVRGGI